MPLSSELFERYRQELRFRNYAAKTIKTYTSCLRQYVRWLAPTHPREATPDQVRAYLLEGFEAGRSRPWVDQSLSALRFLYIELYHWDTDAFRAVPRPRRGKTLPYVPTRDEVLRLAGATNNRRHRLAVLLLYAAGLRVAELCALRVCDVRQEDLALLVRGGKGRKDRRTLLSGQILNDLMWLTEGRPPGEPLFRSTTGKHWRTRSVQKVVARARKRARLHPKLTPHSLRHAFATHLRENGTDIRIIQGLLGHARIETTTRYTRLRDPTKLQVVSPL